ncbi:peptidoglycan bridge formation protein FemAB [Bifidobacterium aemilianum]|uniref:Peptidoglycan bridge formation protein FemAB n=1 Tax=Bifidobacterium aemilianum TaxID=2493120 RepID=A0A366K6M1_9BIFI|nr:GNAT family N-acetyltransferase [Bifidobacterium aemilianum]RBP97329.1 peptidoglycan bridge formation protein FemAB [Bifidobacterium aemilianum]
MIQVRRISIKELEATTARLGLTLPIEQTAVWRQYQDTIDGRSNWGAVAVENDGSPLAFVDLTDYRTHGYHSLHATHAPVWVREPSAKEEQAALQALAAFVRREDRKQVFLRIAVTSDLGMTRPVLSTIAYDQTVVIDVTGGDEEILSRMKSRGRRDVRKSLRESPAVCADETELAQASFQEYYDVMRETAERDGFNPAPCSDYEDMIRILGQEHCRVYAGRVDDQVVTWSIVTISGSRAVRYYGASLNNTMRGHVTDKLVYFECCDLGANKDVESYDMMGIGDDFAPSLKGLNEFKTKFTKEVTPVAPSRDIPLRKAFYWSLVTAKRLRDR